MLCKELKVVNLNITEDFYEYKALFRLCTDEKCMDIDLPKLSEDDTINDIKRKFGLNESNDEIREILMEKVMEASKIESRIVEGESCCKDINNEKIQRNIDTLSRS